MLTASDVKLLQQLFDKNNDRLREELREDIHRAIKPLATKDQLELLATKEELKFLATKDDLKLLATKEELKSLTTKEQLKAIADKVDFESLATKERLASFEKLLKQQGRTFTRKLNLIIGYFDREIVGLRKQIDSIKRIQS
ncbi:MAG: hypothetical protein H0W89_02490 [Candidatus Levybacteria bacterium]|nr:hypothetical protein [Candidatus Levybacteria bacterium]